MSYWKNVAEETSEVLRTPPWPILCDSVSRVTVKSDDLVIEEAVVCSQMLSSIPYVSYEECVSPQWQQQPEWDVKSFYMRGGRLN